MNNIPIQQKVTKKLLDRKEIAYLSKDISDKCFPIGYINMYEVYPKARYGTDTGIIFDCSKVKVPIKRETVIKGEPDIIIALSSRNFRERTFPNITKLQP